MSSTSCSGRSRSPWRLLQERVSSAHLSCNLTTLTKSIWSGLVPKIHRYRPIISAKAIHPHTIEANSTQRPIIKINSSLTQLNGPQNKSFGQLEDLSYECSHLPLQTQINTHRHQCKSNLGLGLVVIRLMLQVPLNGRKGQRTTLRVPSQ